MDLIDLKMEEDHGSTLRASPTSGGNGTGSLAGARTMMTDEKINQLAHVLALAEGWKIPQGFNFATADDPRSIRFAALAKTAIAAVMTWDLVAIQEASSLRESMRAIADELGCKEYEITTRLQLVNDDLRFLKEVGADVLNLLDILLRRERPPTGVAARVRKRLIKALESDYLGVES